jgi:hypothetical protein
MKAFADVPGAGIEPARELPHWFLRPTRLPIPPSGHLKNFVVLKRGAKIIKTVFCNNLTSIHYLI